jgi:hypothetical protein
MDFFRFMRGQGVDDPEGLMLFVTQFLEDPSVISKFSKEQLKEFETSLDCALAPFKNES